MKTFKPLTAEQKAIVWNFCYREVGENDDVLRKAIWVEKDAYLKSLGTE